MNPSNSSNEKSFLSSFRSFFSSYSSSSSSNSDEHIHIKEINEEDIKLFSIFLQKNGFTPEKALIFGQDNKLRAYYSKKFSSIILQTSEEYRKGSQKNKLGIQPNTEGKGISIHDDAAKVNTISSEKMSWIHQAINHAKNQPNQLIVSGSSSAAPSLDIASKLEIVPMLNLNHDEIKEAVFGQHYSDEIQNIEDFAPFVTYRGLSDEKRQLVRKHIYDSIYPLISTKIRVNERIDLPCVTGFAGEEIYLTHQDNNLKIIGQKIWPHGNFGDTWELLIKKNGEITFNNSSYEKNRNIVFIKNETDDFTYNESEKSPTLNKDSEFPPGIFPERYFHIGPSIIELFTFKLNQITSFLEEGRNESFTHVFTQCLNVFGWARNIKASSSSSSSSSSSIKAIDSLVEMSYKDAKEIITLGPMTNPAISSQDSSFTWTITKTQDKCSIELTKDASGRFGHSSSQRKLILSQNQAHPNEIEIELDKSNSADDGVDQSNERKISLYTLKIDEGKPVIIPQGVESWSEKNFNFVISDKNGRMLGLDPFREHTTLDENPEWQKDVLFGIKVLTTITDLQNSPHTLIEKDGDIYNLQGQKLPKEYVYRRFEFPQGNVSGSPYLYSVYPINPIKTLFGKPIQSTKSIQ